MSGNYHESTPIEPFELPEGFLDGPDSDVAQRWVDGRYADLSWQLETSPEASHEAIFASMQVLDRYRERLAQQDEGLAAALARQATNEAEDLRAGLRYTVSGQAHLLGERILKITQNQQS